MMINDQTPYRDKDFTDEERWAEREAQFCDKMVNSLLNTVKEHTEKALANAMMPPPNGPYTYLHLQPAYEVSVQVHVWQTMADHLRRSRISRLENKRD